jgi:tRNA threonylcarbamoyladenosine biosynthesis protein TsaB
MILCIETATQVCSVALCDINGVVLSKENTDPKSHAMLLTGYIEELLNEQGIKAADLEAVAVSKGPGSYTGLRIGVSVTKGIAYRASIPLIGIETTASMYYGMIKRVKEKDGITDDLIICPMLDARRMEVYYCLYGADGKLLKNISAEIINENSFSDIPGKVKIIFFGDGSAKCSKIIRHNNSVFVNDFTVSATNMHIPAYEAFNNRVFEDVAYFEPFYLKDFIATTPKNKIIIK